MEQTDDQSAALEFLARRDSYDPLPDAEPIHISTHGSHVFLTGDRAFKMKRAVTFPYMDYGTLERRKKFTEAELELNRRTAPELYVGIRRITRQEDGSLAFDGSGNPVEYVLEMRRFDEEKLLDRMAERGDLTAEIVEQTAARIREFHDIAQPLAPGDAPGAGAAGLRAVVEENFEEFGAQPKHFEPAETEAYASQVRAALDALAPVLDRRLETGQAKHCHGDLHLRNICLIDGAPTLFDGLEFNPEFACIDTLYDFAYFLSDLVIRGYPDYANLAFNRYFAAGDYDGMECLPLFISTRSAVRAKVMVSVAEAQESAEARAHMLSESQRSFAAARQQIAPAKPLLIGVGGFSGSGKSTLAKSLAPRLSPVPGAVHLRSDLIRKEMFQVTPSDRLPDAAYRPEVSRDVYALMLERGAAALARGYSVIFDAVNDREEDRERIDALATSLSLPFFGFWLQVSEADMAARIEGRRGDASDATADVMKAQVARGHGALGNWIKIDADGSPEATLQAVLKDLKIGV